MNKKHMLNVGKYLSITCLLFVCSAILSCRDEYIYDDPDKVPEWLGESIYEELQGGKNFPGQSFKYFLKVIDDCNYKDVLMATGSKTLFVANDEAFIKGIKERWPEDITADGDEAYNQLKPGQKRTILFSAMLDNAYLLEMMSSTPASGSGEPMAGECLRRSTSADVLDTIYYYGKEQLPENNPHWDRFRETGIRMALDGTEPMMVHFLAEQLKKIGVQPEDMWCLFNDSTLTVDDAFIYDKKVLQRDVTCKNGYIHLLDGLLIPPSNMAEEIRRDSTLSMYSRMLDRYAVPVYNQTLSDRFNTKYNTNERVYEKRYYTSASNRTLLAYKDYEGNNYTTKADSSLKFSPGWNRYRSTSYKEDVDMAAMFVPTNEALALYFSPEGEGYSLIERYGAIDSIELNIVSKLIGNMMEPTFNGSIPSKFVALKDDANDEKGVSPSDVVKTIIANNGVIYVTNKVYSPAEYVSVSAPSQFNADMSAMYNIIKEEGYQSYLLAMKSFFSLINPTNDAFIYYDPVTAHETKPLRYKIKLTNGELKYYSNEYDKGAWGSDKTVNVGALTSNINYEILENNIVVGNIKDGNKYYQTKGLSTIKVATEVNGVDTIVTQIWGGRELEQMNAGEREGGITITRTFPQKNGNTYRVEEGLIHPATRSVYNVLSETEEFKPFFELCNPVLLNDIADKAVSVTDNGYTPSDSAVAEKAAYLVFENVGTNAKPVYNVSAFTPYHYTVYVPGKESIEEAVQAGLPTLEELSPIATEISDNLELIEKWSKELEMAEDDRDTEVADSLRNLKVEYIAINEALRTELKESLSLVVGFVKYHMQGNAVFVDNNPDKSLERTHRTTAWDAENSRFDAVGLALGKNSMSVKGLNADKNLDEPFVECHVVTEETKEGIKENVHYNVMAREIVKNGSQIAASSHVVIHLIDRYLVNARLADMMKQYKDKKSNR